MTTYRAHGRAFCALVQSNRRALRALALLGAIAPLAAGAAEPQYRPIPAVALAKAAEGGKLGRAREVEIPVSTEIRATLGADGKVHTDCVTVRRSAFDAAPPAARRPPTEAQ